RSPARGLWPEQDSHRGHLPPAALANRRSPGPFRRLARSVAVPYPRPGADVRDYPYRAGGPAGGRRLNRGGACMCGRYTLEKVDALRLRFRLETETKPEAGPRYNVAPRQLVVVVVEDGERRLDTM